MYLVIFIVNYQNIQYNLNFDNLHAGFHQKAMVLRLNKPYIEALDFIMKEKERTTQYFHDDNLKLSVNAYEYGYISYLMNRIEEANMHMEQCLDYALKTDDLIAQACAYRGLAEISWKKDEFKLTYHYFDKAYDLFIKVDDNVGAKELNQI